NSVTYSVAQVSKPAVSPTSQSADRPLSWRLRIWKSAIQQVWKPALRHRICARLHLAGGFGSCAADSVNGFALAKADPVALRNEAEADQQHLTRYEDGQPGKGPFHKPVGMQPDAEEIHAKPGEAGHDVAENGHVHQPALAH